MSPSTSAPQGTPFNVTVSSDCAAEAQEHRLDVPIYYSCGVTGLIVLASIYYFFQLKQKKLIFVEDFTSGVSAYFSLIIKFKAMYGLLFNQMLDQISDISVMYQMYQLWQSEDNGKVACDCMY